MDVLEIAPGLWRWTAYHEEWHEDVGCTFVNTEDGAVLIDPLVPANDDARFWKALDRDVKRAKGRVHVFVTVFWHTRSAAAMRERYDARIWAPKAARRQSRGAPASSPTPSRSATSFGRNRGLPHRPRCGGRLLGAEHSALVPGDVLIGDGKGGAKMCPESWLPDGKDAPRPRGLARPLLDLPVRRILVSHGKPVVTGGGRALARARDLDALALGAAGCGRAPRRPRRRRLQPARPARNEAETGWANIDVQLQRRGDLIPNLVEAVKGYAAHERGVFEEVTKARAALRHAQTPGAAGEANDILTAALGRLFAVAEAYPDLKASENFLRLQDDLTDTEDKISAARRYYNSTVMHYNTAIQSIRGCSSRGRSGSTPRSSSPRGPDTTVPQVALAPAP